MDNKKHSDRFCFRARIFAVLLAGVFLIPASHAQQTVQNRYLLIFDTSADMKKRVPMMQKALDNLFLTGLNGQLQPGDSIGIWTFGQELSTGQFHLISWVPDEAATVAKDINSFIGKQHYAKTAGFGALQPLMNKVVQDSDRLTMLIFCDGETPMSGTPYDAGINQIFQQRQAAQKTAKQPFIIVLRAQLGQYVGCTMIFPPEPPNFPAFPPLPAPPAPTNQPPPATPPAPANQPPPQPRVVLPPMIMIGTNAGTRPPNAPRDQPPQQPTILPSPIAIETNTVAKPPAPKLEVANSPLPAAASNPVAKTNATAAPAKVSMAQTNATALQSENPRLGSGGALAVGAAFLAAAGGLVVFMLRRSRRPGHASLITRSMKKN